MQGKKGLSMNNVMPFGKYKGTPLDKLPDSYVAWLLHDEILREPLKTILRNVVWEKISKEGKDKFIDEWIANSYVVKRWNSSYYNGPDPSDNGYDCPYDEWDAYGNLCVDFGF